MPEYTGEHMIVRDARCGRAGWARNRAYPRKASMQENVFARILTCTEAYIAP